jgi:superfamily II DNA helicase RecQ
MTRGKASASLYDLEVLVSLPRLLAAQETFENLLVPGKKWHPSPYIEAAFSEAGDPSWIDLLPVYQSVIVDLLRESHLPPVVSLLDLGAPAGIGAMAALDALLAWYVSCTLYGLPPQVERLHVRVVPGPSLDPSRPWAAFCDWLEARARDFPALPGLSQVARWAREWSLPPDLTPNLVLVTHPGERSSQVRALLNKLPEGAILVGVEWQPTSPNAATESVFRWRYDILRERTDWVALGPCGQEYGRDLPEACQTCSHGCREYLHRPAAGAVSSLPWTYAMLRKGMTPVDSPRPTPISAEVLEGTAVDCLSLRYIGTWRGRIIQAGHPDETHDAPKDEKWREYFKACPGLSGAERIAIERPAGLHFPRLRYGQWLFLRDLRIQRPYPQNPQAYTLQVRNESSFLTRERWSLAETFLPEYTPEVRAAADEAAHRLFGFRALREFQHQILAQVLCGRDILAIAATGGGKSECYILPAILLPGFTVVVSPLKSLMLDQYEQRIRDRYGLDHLTTFINGDVPYYERWGRLRRLALGHYKLLYTTPEQLERGYVLDALRQADQQVGFRYLAMDEAHCISQWGHDFRSSYLNIVQRLRDFGLNPCRLAVTATASPLVREDICLELDLDPRDIHRGGNVFIESADRPELNLVVYRMHKTEGKARYIVEALHRLGDNGSAIVFMPHTGGTPERPRDMGAPKSDPCPENVGMVSPGVTPFAEYLSRQLGVPIAIYHGALDDASPSGATNAETADMDDATASRSFRTEEQRAFMSGQKRIMVATKGFGMGVDKPNIRLVIHRSPPANLEAYLQEAGRAGRDGQLATVVLLFSEDKPKITNLDPNTWLPRTDLPSDREIQQYFIEQRFVRRQDVEAMVAFLRSNLLLRINGAMYFTNDQVMAFFDQLSWQPSLAGLSQPYQWPPFPPRTPGKTWESPEHRQILERGYLYNQKRKHIGRILAVLFNNRPTIGGQVMPLVRSVHEVGLMLRGFRLHQSEQIVNSSAYFGECLRRADIGSEELRNLLPNGEYTEITELARRLGLSLRETASMLSDIRYCEGHTDKEGRWKGTLLDFWWIEAPRWVSIDNPYDITRWRAYAGARTRARPEKGKSLDDYFPWRVLNLPTGWEVVPGPGLEYPDWTAYLKEFMRLHDERKQNDWSNFEYLLTHYIGVNQEQPQCLRAVLLGYLKTNEVVVGGKCYGCSVCVPDLNFQQYPISLRQQSVVRLMLETIALMEQIEARNREPPSPQLLDQVLDAIAQEDALGRSGTTYLESYLARLIQDDPEHHAALWLRLHALDRKVISLSPIDVPTTIERLVHLSREPWEWMRLAHTVDGLLEDPQYQDWWIPLMILAAELASRQGQPKQEAEIWYDVIQRIDQQEQRDPRSEEWMSRGLKRLGALIGQYWDLLAERQATKVRLRLARFAETSSQEAHSLYQKILSSWQWSDVEDEISTPRTAHPDAAALAWLDVAPPSGHEPLLKWIADHPNVWSRWTSEAIRTLDDRLGPSLDRNPQALLAGAHHLMAQAGKETLAAEFLLRAWAAGAPLSRSQLIHLANFLSQLPPDECQKRLQSGTGVSKLLQKLIEVSSDCQQVGSWLPLFTPRAIQNLPDDLVAKLLEGPTSQNTPPPTILLETIAKKSLLKWMADHPDVWSQWPLETIRALDRRLRLSLDRSPEILLAGTHHLMAQSGKETLAAEFLLRAWAAGAPLSRSQLIHLANFLSQLPPDGCRKRLQSRADASKLLQELIEVSSDCQQVASWLPLFPPGAIQNLPDDLVAKLLEGLTSQNTPPPTILLETIAIRVNAGNQVLLNQTAHAVANHPYLAAPILQVVVDRDPLWPEMVRVLFPYLLQDPNPATAADILDRLTTRSDLLRGNDRVACCLDNWKALRMETDVWRYLKKPWIEGIALVEIVNRWIKNALDKPHRLDMLVVILKEVKGHSPSTWLTPASLLFQTFCQAGRFAEAQTVLKDYPNLSVRGQSAPEHLQSWKTRAPERVARFEDEFQRLWRLISKLL